MKISLFVFGAAVLSFSIASTSILSTSMASTDESRKNDPKRMFKAMACYTCHGKDAKSAIMDYPNLTGLDEKYLINQIKDIAEGKRVGSIDPANIPRTEGMKKATAGISDKQVKILAAWLSEQDIFEPEERYIDMDSFAKGKELYVKLRCATCHGKKGAKPRKGYPSLAAQRRNYLYNQMVDIKNKVRVNGRSKSMVPFMRKASEEDIGHLADYLSKMRAH